MMSPDCASALYSNEELFNSTDPLEKKVARMELHFRTDVDEWLTENGTSSPVKYEQFANTMTDVHGEAGWDGGDAGGPGRSEAGHRADRATLPSRSGGLWLLLPIDASPRRGDASMRSASRRRSQPLRRRGGEAWPTIHQAQAIGGHVTMFGSVGKEGKGVPRPPSHWAAWPSSLEPAGSVVASALYSAAVLRRHDDVLDLGRAFVDLRDARVSVIPLRGHVTDIAHAA